MRAHLKHATQAQGTARVPWATLGLTIVISVLYLWMPAVFESLVFRKGAVYSGEWWRLLTGHFVHCSFEHFFWDLAAFALLGSVLESRSQLFISVLLWSCAAVSGWLIWGETSFAEYCGLSGALNGVLVVAAWQLWREQRRRVYLWAIAAAAAKIIFELTTHQTIFTSLASQAVPGAHTAGLLAGFSYVWIHSIMVTRPFGQQSSSPPPGAERTSPWARV